MHQLTRLAQLASDTHQQRLGHGPRAYQQHLAQAGRDQPGAGRRPRRAGRPAGPRAVLNAASGNLNARRAGSRPVVRSALPRRSRILGTTPSYVTGETTMYSTTLSYQTANAHTADLHRQATRERPARAAARARAAHRPLPGRTVTAVPHRVLARLIAHRPSPTR